MILKQISVVDRDSIALKMFGDVHTDLINDHLTHWGWDKMVAIFQTKFFKCIILNENEFISIDISQKFVPKGPINNIPALVQIMAWHRPGDKPLSEPMMVNLLTHVCATQPQWVNTLWPSYAIWWHRSGPTLVQVMPCCLTAPSHYPNQYWLTISELFWHSPEGNFTGNAQDIYPWYEFEKYEFKITAASQRGQEINIWFR